MSKRKKKEKRTIVLNDGKPIEIPKSEPVFMLYPYNSRTGVRYSENRLMLQVVRPACIVKKKLGRYCKDKVYQIMATHCAEANISGSYVGLPANYMGEIFTNFSPFIKGNFYTYEKDKKSYEALLEYREFVAGAYPQKTFKVDFKVIRGDIIKEMSKLRHEAAIIDLDLMTGIGLKEGCMPEDVAKSIHNCGRDTIVVGIWQLVGRWGWTDEEMTHIVRPAVRSALEDYFNVERHDKIEYWEGYPMRVDIYTLERKNKWKKALFKAA